jgi:hypothetical protein
MISQALEDANIDVSASALGLANIKKLLGQDKKEKDDGEEKGIQSEKLIGYFGLNVRPQFHYKYPFQTRTKSRNLRLMLVSLR